MTGRLVSWNLTISIVCMLGVRPRPFFNAVLSQNVSHVILGTLPLYIKIARSRPSPSSISMLSQISSDDDRHDDVSTTYEYSSLFQDGYDSGTLFICYSQMYKFIDFHSFQAISKSVF